MAAGLDFQINMSALRKTLERVAGVLTKRSISQSWLHFLGVFNFLILTNFIFVNLKFKNFNISWETKSMKESRRRPREKIHNEIVGRKSKRRKRNFSRSKGAIAVPFRAINPRL